MTSNTVSDALFTDALSGVDGTADVPPPRWRPETFPDALVAPQVDPAQPIAMPPVPVPEVAAPRMPGLTEDWVADLGLPASATGAGGTSADRAEAARRAAAARRDATVASRRPGQRSGVGAGQKSGQRSRSGSSPSAGPVARPAARTPAARPPAARPPAAAPLAVAPASATPVRQAVTSQRPVPPAARPVPAQRPPVRPAAPGRRKSGGAWGAIVFLIILLVASGLGRQILNALSELINK